MGKITEVFYGDVSLQDCSVKSASRYNFLVNAIGIHPRFDQEFEKYEMEQMKIKGKVIGDAVRKGEISHPKVTTTIFGVSSMYERAVVITEI